MSATQERLKAPVESREPTFPGEYVRGLKQFIVTSRFNDRTWAENQAFRQQHPKFGCIYCAPTTITSMVPVDTPIFVLEMNE
jgi:hypothetical protein